jgi:formate dehydrogenase accessory protein FdhD
MGSFEEDKSLSAQVLGAGKNRDWVLPTEFPIGLVYGGHEHAVMMATPSDLHDFALGFALAEGILHHADEMASIEIRERQHGIELHCDIPANRLEKLQMHGQRRATRGRAGCGICGVDNLTDALRPLPRLQTSAPVLEPAQILQAIQNLPAKQIMRARNHTVHGAAWVNTAGELSIVREDIGRHNALDKMIGAWAKDGQNRPEGLALLSSRCTYELVQKCALTGIGSLVCLAAPTLNAVETARRANLNLMIFERKTGELLLFSP